MLIVSWMTPRKPHRSDARNLASTLLLTLTLTTHLGCTGLEPAMIGAAASAAATGTSVLAMGKLNAVYLADMDRVTNAIRQSLQDTGHTITRDEPDPPYRHRITAEDLRGEAVLIRVEQRTKQLTRYRFDVGLFGSNATAKLLFQRTEFYLEHQQPPPLTTPLLLIPAPPATTTSTPAPPNSHGAHD